VDNWFTWRKQKTAHIPLTVFQKILEGALKWNGPLAGFTLHRFLKNDINFNLFL